MTKEIKDKALVLESKDKGESDKILTLFSLDKGKIFAKIRGVKKPKAKLAFAALPFCFGEFILNENKGFLTVINCNPIDNFFDITYDLNSFYVGSSVLEIVKTLLRQEEKNADLFVLTLKALNALAYKNVNILLLLSKFIYHSLDISGYKINIDSCKHLSKDNNLYFDYESGEIRCGENSNNSLIKIDYNVLDCFLKIENLTFDELNLEINGSKTLLRLLLVYFEDKIGEKLECPKVFF